jgi:drug/metabolite transporter (DMT)-like permease
MMEGQARNHGRGIMVALVLFTVVIQIAVAVLLKELADARTSTGAWVVLVLGAAVGLNGIRFLVWGYTHRYFPLSHSYPLTALFFPCVLLVSAWYGERIAGHQVLAVAIIMAGLAAMTWNNDAGV